jgi:hypothetical protein
VLDPKSGSPAAAMALRLRPPFSESRSAFGYAFRHTKTLVPLCWPRSTRRLSTVASATAWTQSPRASRLSRSTPTRRDLVRGRPR